MSSDASTSLPKGRISRFLVRQGIAGPLAWGFVGLTLFMVGDGIEQGFLAPYLDELGFSAGDIAALFSAYGIVVAVAAWLAGALAEAWGPRRVMLIGATLWAVLEVVFLFAVTQHNYAIMIAAYAVRAIGYPFFAYGFLVWITMDTPSHVMGKAVGWYWFANIMGLGVISAYLAGIIIPLAGELVTLWLSLGFVVAGGLIVAALVKSRMSSTGVTVKDTVSGLVQGVAIMKDKPRVGIGGIVRLINTISFYAFTVFLSVHMVKDIGFTLPQWQAIWGTMLTANVVANLAAGYLSDRIGRINVIAWGGGIGSMLAILAFYYVPQTVGANFAVVMAIGVFYGAALAMYVPLSAVVPLLAPRHKAAGVAVLNLGAGLSNFCGPLLAGLVGPLGIAPVVWILAGLSIIGFFLTYVLRQPGVEVDDAEQPDRAAAREFGQLPA
jgi:polyol permease family